MNKDRLIKLLVGRQTVDYVRGRRVERRQHPLEKLEGESRWEALDSDAPISGPYAMLDEQAADQLTGETYLLALRDLSSSCEEQPVGSGGE